MNSRGLIVWWDLSGAFRLGGILPAMLRIAMQADRRVDDFRAINAITLREQIVPDLESGRKSFGFFCTISPSRCSSQIS
jgi:hypothetical protein